MTQKFVRSSNNVLATSTYEEKEQFYYLRKNTKK